VVVVGLGPVGATIALLVARAGAPVVALERDAEPYPHPRAVALDDDALRVLQAAGVRDGDGLELLPGGTVRIRGRGARPLVELGPPPTTTGHPGLAFFRQPHLEEVLRERLAAEPLVDVRLGTTVLGVASPGGPGRDAVLRVAGPDGEAGDLRASWVLACDGGRSGIRAALGVRLRGATSPSRWLVVDTDAPAADETPSFVPGDFEFGADPSGPWVHGPLPGGAHRWEFLLDRRMDAGPLADPAVARALLARRLGEPVPVVRRAGV
jgi:3-(3-hydroxy-phenyl)propionate hydroxylase